MKDRLTEIDELNKVTVLCPIREQAFFTIMRQSGLTPQVIKQLKVKNLEPNMPIPCKIDTPQEKHPTFIGAEAIKYLKQYLATREKLTPESLLFTLNNNPNKEINTKNVSRTFKLKAQELERTKKITYAVQKGKPSELRLFSLIKFYRKNAKNYLTELKNNPNKDEDFYRILYEEKALPLLEIETPTTTELKNRIEELEENTESIKNQYENQIKTLEKHVNEIDTFAHNKLIQLMRSSFIALMKEAPKEVIIKSLEQTLKEEGYEIEDTNQLKNRLIKEGFTTEEEFQKRVYKNKKDAPSENEPQTRSS
jgi:hypothetical protein